MMDNAVVKDIDVFVSYSHKDKAVADGMVAALENHKLRCWYAPRDIAPGQDWASSIMAAIRRAKFFVLVFSDNSNQSGQVMNEVTNAYNSGCVIIPFKIDQSEMHDNLSYYLMRLHWLDAVQPPMTDRYEELVEQILSTMGREVPEDLQNRLNERRKKDAKKNSGKKIPAAAIVGIAAAVIVVIAAAAFVVLGSGSSSQSEEEPQTAAAEEEMQEEETEEAAVSDEEEVAEEAVLGEAEVAEEASGETEEEETSEEEVSDEGTQELDASLVSEDGYILKAEAIPEEALDKMLTELEDAYYAYSASEWNTGYTTIVGFDCIGFYFLAEKDSASPHNMIYLVCQVNIEYFAESAAGFTDSMITCYYYGEYENLMILDDGTFSVDYTDLGTPSATFTEFNLSFKGYQDLDSMFSELVTSRIDKYTYENTVEDRDFGYELTQLDSARAIPDDAKEYNGHYYMLYSVSDMTWTQAKEQCELRGGHLVTVTSEEEMNFIAIQVIDSGTLWCGGYYDVSGKWLWVTGEDMEYTDWLADPDGVTYPYMTITSAGWMDNKEDGGNYYGVISGGNGYNSSTAGYICEWDSSELPDSEGEDSTDEEAAAEPEETDAETE